MHFDSKLPDVGTTIFTVMSRRALDENALNIGQGFPDYPVDPRLSQSLVETIAEGRNQYAPMEGVVDLRERIAHKLHSSYALSFDPQTEITVTCGGTEALYDAIQAVVRAGDEVIIFDPAYDAYEPAVRLAGGRCLRVPLQPPTFRYDWDRVRESLSDRTRLIIINSPQNPSCSVADASDLDALAALVRDRPISILADEVYEHVLYDGRRHASVLAHAELRERSFAVFSFGKTLHATGWRVGYCVAPPAMTRELRKVHQFNTFSIASPLQHAIARYISQFPDAWIGPANVFPGQARSIGRAAARLGLRAGAGGGHVFSAGRLWCSQPIRRHRLRRPADSRSQDCDHPVVAFLCGAAADDVTAALHRQTRRNPRGSRRPLAALRRLFVKRFALN